jgi:hypothetical protein
MVEQNFSDARIICIDGGADFRGREFSLSISNTAQQQQYSSPVAPMVRLNEQRPRSIKSGALELGSHQERFIYPATGSNFDDTKIVCMQAN